MATGEGDQTVGQRHPAGEVTRRAFRWRVLVLGGVVGSVVGVAGATITDSKMGFPAWVDLTGVLGGFAAGVLATGLILLLRSAQRHRRSARSGSARARAR